MSHPRCSGSDGQAIRRLSSPPGVAADWLALAATPTFAVMALLTAVTDGADVICSSTPGTSPMNGMAAMYLLMSVFHAAAWLKRLSRGGSG